MEDLSIFWDDQEIGLLIDPAMDMWYIEGKWASNGSHKAMEFENLAKTFIAKGVMADPSKGTSIQFVQGSSSSQMHAWVISLDDDILFIRIVYS